MKRYAAVRQNRAAAFLYPAARTQAPPVSPCVQDQAGGLVSEKPSGAQHPSFPAEKHRVSLACEGL